MPAEKQMESEQLARYPLLCRLRMHRWCNGKVDGVPGKLRWKRGHRFEQATYVVHRACLRCGCVDTVYSYQDWKWVPPTPTEATRKGDRLMPMTEANE